jgi:hypothetical protein
MTHSVPQRSRLSGLFRVTSRRVGFGGYGGRAVPATPAGSWRSGVRPGPTMSLPRVVPIEAFLAGHKVTIDLAGEGVAFPATFSAGGVAQSQIGPSRVGESWALDQAYLSTSVGQLDAAQCALYQGVLPLASFLITANLAGGGSQFGLGGVGLIPGEFLFAVWTGSTPGAQAFLRATGTKTVLVPG